MTVNVYAGRYAKAIFRLALENKELNRWQSDIHKVNSILSDAALLTYLNDPQVKWDDKAKMLTQRLGEIHPVLNKLVSVLTAKGKLALVGDIADEYQRLVDNYRGIEGAETAEVVTAIPLDNEYQLKLAQRITEMVGKPVILKLVVDPAIIGGLIIKVGDKLIDGSIRNKLASLRKDLGGVKK
ncbi:MAG: F0F1 ATP synthase subunit delta [Dehalococcoidales bacterium]|nr:F0F1 ATP synthase subunit delta [Dehalococcoidales bacterium]